MMVDSELTARTRSRYELLAPVFDRMQALMERRFRPWRRRLLGTSAEMGYAGVLRVLTLPLFRFPVRTRA